MNCPACDSGELKKHSLSKYLQGEKCTQCSGVSFTLGAYLNYLQKSVASTEELPGDSIELILDTDNKQVMKCSCGHLMNKFRIDQSTERRVDYCTACQTIWLDKGEWDYLIKNNLHRQINKIFTNHYQRNLRLQGNNLVLQQQYKNQLGEEDYLQLKQIREWIQSHSAKSTIMAYLNAEDPYSVIK